jgi:predicted nucleic acid-binding protein
LNYLLDACALIAFFDKEPEGVIVKDLFNRIRTDDISFSMSIINLAEVYYGFIRKYKSVEQADLIMREATELPITIIDTISHAVYRDAAHMKARYSMSLADTFLCATAKNISATIVTKDGEIAEAEQAEPLSVLWIKQ